jgi:ABC-2 type transport system ATP-binding protein
MSATVRTFEVSKHYRRVPVLDGLNLAVPETSVFGLIGPNGVGKAALSWIPTT